MRQYSLPFCQKIRRNPVLFSLFLITLIAAVIIGVIKGKDEKDTAKQTHIPSVRVEKSIRQDVPVYLAGLGTVQAYNTVEVESQVLGQLIEVLFREGQEVHKGDVLAQIDPRSYQAQLAQAVANKAKNTASLTNAKQDLERYIQLGTMISTQIIDTQRAMVLQLEATLRSDQAAIDSAETLLSYTTITAPIDGRTGLRMVDIGNIVQPGGGSLVVITQMEPISVLFSLPATSLQSINHEINVQRELKVIVQDSSTHEILDKGVLELVDNQIDKNTGTILLKATLPNKERKLWPGGFVDVRLLLMVRKDSLVVPLVALQYGPKGSYVFVLQPDNSVKMRQVKVAFIEAGDAIIEDGIEEGEIVVTEGAASLEEGVNVAVIDAP